MLSILLIIIYRPLGPYSEFLVEFDLKPNRLFRESINSLYIHFGSPENPIRTSFMSGLGNVIEPTHDGHTLDLVLTFGLIIKNIYSHTSTV